MSIKRMSLRFNLDNEADRKAWEHLKNTANSKNKAVISEIVRQKTTGHRQYLRFRR